MKRRSNRIWADEDENKLWESNGNLTVDELGILLNYRYTKDQIRRKLFYTKIPYRDYNNKEVSEKLQNALNAYYKNKGQITRIPINHDFFKTWSNDMAYVFGLFMSDGNIWSNGKKHKFTIELKSNDDYLLRNILIAMNSDHKVHTSSNGTCSNIQLSSKTIFEDIVNLGGLQKKSLILTMPYIPLDFASHFIRGVFDGDGCIYYRDNSYYNSYICSASECFIRDLLLLITTLNTNIKPTINCNDGLYRLYFNKKNTLLLGELMYLNNTELHLIRKYTKFKHASIVNL